MGDVTLDALASQLERLLRELTETRKELAGIRAAQTDLSNGQTALAQALLHIKRDGVIKDILARIDGQVRKLEEEKGRVEER
jgi:predicted  nucleic acid-binding Zn-ribbon protein